MTKRCFEFVGLNEILNTKEADRLDEVVFGVINRETKKFVLKMKTSKDLSGLSIFNPNTRDYVQVKDSSYSLPESEVGLYAMMNRIKDIVTEEGFDWSTIVSRCNPARGRKASGTKKEKVKVNTDYKVVGLEVFDLEEEDREQVNKLSVYHSKKVEGSKKAVKEFVFNAYTTQDLQGLWVRNESGEKVYLMEGVKLNAKETVTRLRMYADKLEQEKSKPIDMDEYMEYEEEEAIEAIPF